MTVPAAVRRRQVIRASGSESLVVAIARRVAGLLAFRAIVTYRQEVRPVYAVSAAGAPLQSTISRLR